MKLFEAVFSTLGSIVAGIGILAILISCGATEKLISMVQPTVLFLFGIIFLTLGIIMIGMAYIVQFIRQSKEKRHYPITCSARSMV